MRRAPPATEQSLANGIQRQISRRLRLGRRGRGISELKTFCPPRENILQRSFSTNAAISCSSTHQTVETQPSLHWPESRATNKYNNESQDIIRNYSNRWHASTEAYASFFSLSTSAQGMPIRRARQRGLKMQCDTKEGPIATRIYGGLNSNPAVEGVRETAVSDLHILSG